jgi:hypothetical protein
MAAALAALGLAASAATEVRALFGWQATPQPSKGEMFPAFDRNHALSLSNQPLLARTGSWLWATFLLLAPRTAS